MQFVKNGPDIPDTLLQAHEDGRVVLFCGAGISYPAGLPDFKGLVDAIYKDLGTDRNAIEDQAYQQFKYDAVLDLLERRIAGQRRAIRGALARVLKPNLRLKRATDTHSALLQLATGREGSVRLVTTNFDRVFQRVIERQRLGVPAYPAPLLPIPKNSRWHGLVYLHGLLPARSEDESALNRLVVTSGDFGLAYLTERWAARFVSELFRNYVVCFVGYSINDPVLRYMMDALAADRMQGEATPQAYAFGDYRDGQIETKKIEWEAKGVVPILYEVPSGTRDHSGLHLTLKEWASTHRDGQLGKERIVANYASIRPTGSTKEDDFVGRLLWALSDGSGLPARHFADFNPVPSLDWLDPICKSRYGHHDLARFRVPAQQAVDDKLSYSLASRPAPYGLAPWMCLATQGGQASQWDDVMQHLARWLARHLNDPALALWVARQGGLLHRNFLSVIEHRLEELAKLELSGKTTELENIQANAPNAIPGPLMRIVWRLLLTGRLKTTAWAINLFRWRERLARDGVSASLRFELRELLAPKITIREPFRLDTDGASTGEPQRLQDIMRAELALASDHVQSTLSDLCETAAWESASRELFADFDHLLLDALDLMRELGTATDTQDRSHWDMPSISPHWQNRGFHDWVALIELLRDAWIKVHQSNPQSAAVAVDAWRLRPYPTFKRLALFAATFDGIAKSGEWVDWLLSDQGWWLWAVDTQREAMRLLVLRGEALPAPADQRLQAAILVGPPREMFREGIEADRWEMIVQHSVWLRLAKLVAGGAKLAAEAQSRFDELSEANPDWALAENESDEFSHWMSGTGDPDYDEKRVIDRAPRTKEDRRKLPVWLNRPAMRGPWADDDWRDVCRERVALASCALASLARENIWPVERWREAMQAWGDEKLPRRSWNLLAKFVESMPDKELHSISHAVAWWLEAVSKVIDRHENSFFVVCSRLLGMEHGDGVSTDQPVTRAINHPTGRVAQALLHLWFRRGPTDGQGLHEDLKALFTQLCDVDAHDHRHGRVVLAANLIALFRVDRAWTEAHLLPRFDWNSSAEEARAAWEGFLWSPRLYRPLLDAYKASFLEAARHYAELNEHGRQYAAILTYAALEPADTFTVPELRSAMESMPPDGLNHAAQTLVHAVEGAGEQREEYWKNRLLPFWKAIWPKSLQFATEAMAGQLAQLAIAARGEFPSATSAVQAWLKPLEHPHYELRLLRQSKLCQRFPKEALQLLSSLISDQPWPSPELLACLEEIEAAWQEVRDEPRYRRLVEYARRRGAT
jgi:hypothetical protein